MENRGLLFIPDISGFTRFVNETEIEHSRLIIQELLEILINANQMELEVSEIEGDAILFYKFGEQPDLKKLYEQVEKMFCAFHKNLIAYEQRRFCQCKACMAAINLTLKVITHYGEFTRYNVKSFSKLIGKDVIVAHQLLKNDIEEHEYWLVTRNLLQDHSEAELPKWIEWNYSIKQTESGEIPYHYSYLGELKNVITPEPNLQTDLSNKRKVLSFTREYGTDIITLFHATGDFQYRHRWLEGVIAVKEIDYHLPRVGMSCRFILKHGEEIIHASGYSYSPGKIEFCETDDENNRVTLYKLEKVNDHQTKLTIDIYFRKSLTSHILFSLTRKKRMEEAYQKSLLHLDQLVKEIYLPAVV